MHAIEEAPVSVPYFFHPQYLQGSAYEGTIRTKVGERVIVIPEELLEGLHNALAFETGRAAPLILHTCGRVWGERLMLRWDQHWRHFYQKRLVDADWDEFLCWLLECFRFHGWGQIELDFSREEDGVVLFAIHDNVLPHVLENSKVEWKSAIFAGLLVELVSTMAGRPLDGCQIACVGRGDEVCRFVIATTDRVEAVRRVRNDDGSTEDMLAALDG